MISSVIADRYAQALLAVATERNQAEAVMERAAWYDKELAPSCAPFLENPNIPREAKEALMEKLFRPVESNEGEETVLRCLVPFVHLLLRKNRIRYLRDIFRLYLTRYAETKGVLAAKLHVAYPIEQPLVDRLQIKFSEQFGRTVVFDVVHDPAILGGFIVATRTDQFDASIRRSLVEIGERLKAVPVG